MSSFIVFKNFPIIIKISYDNYEDNSRQEKYMVCIILVNFCVLKSRPTQEFIMPPTLESLVQVKRL